MSTQSYYSIPYIWKTFGSFDSLAGYLELVSSVRTWRVGWRVSNNHTLAVHVCPRKIIIWTVMYEKFLGVLTIWRIPGNLDKTRTRTYLWGRYPSQEQRYRTAAFSLIAALPHVWPCHVAEWWSGLLLYSLVTWSYSGVMALEARPHCLGRRPKPSLASQSVFVGIWVLSIHGIRGSVFDPWWTVSKCGTNGRREASVLVGKPVGWWSLTKSLPNHLGSRWGR
jgi:hypothetical protein